MYCINMEDETTKENLIFKKFRADKMKGLFLFARDTELIKK